MFIAHNFSFCSKDNDNWFRVLDKYYGGIGAHVIIREKFKARNRHEMKITIHYESFMDALCELGYTIGDNIVWTITTDSYWSEKAGIKAMPLFKDDLFKNLNKNNSDKADEELIYIAKEIDGIITNRYSLEKKEVHLSCNLYCDNFDELLEVLSHVKETKNITRACISHKDEEIIIIIDETSTLFITPKMCRDSYLTPFDIDDGFGGQMGVKFGKWKDEFAVWKDEFDDTNGKNWDKPVIAFQ